MRTFLLQASLVENTFGSTELSNGVDCWFKGQHSLTSNSSHCQAPWRLFEKQHHAVGIGHPLILCSPRRSDAAGNTTAAISTKNENALTGGNNFSPQQFFARQDGLIWRQRQSQSRNPFLVSPICDVAKSTDSRAAGFWTDTRTHEQTEF